MRKASDTIKQIRLKVLKANPGVTRTEELLFLNIQALERVIIELQKIREEIGRR